MDSNEWDDILKDKLDDYTPEGMQPDWSSFSDYLNIHEELSGIEEDNAALDESLVDSLSGFQAPGAIEGWEKIESSLDLADRQFDEQMRQRLEEFEFNYDHTSWPLLLQKLSGIGYLRAKLIAFKVVEVAAVLLLLFTVHKMGQMGKLPFETPFYEKAPQKAKPSVPKRDMAYNGIIPGKGDETIHQPFVAPLKNQRAIPIETVQPVVDTEIPDQLSYNNTSAVTDQHASTIKVDQNNHNRSIPGDDLLRKVKLIEPIHPNTVHTVTSNDVTSINTEPNNSIASITLPEQKDIVEFSEHSITSADFIATFPSPVQWDNEIRLPKPKYIKQRSRTYTEFAVVSQLDNNKLRMPEDKLVSAGREITFPQKGIRSPGFGGGFTIALGHPRWAIETGVIYSAKHFKTGRQLIVGGAFDNGIVDFDAMRMQLVSIPLQYRYRFDNKGAFKVYGLAGFGLHLIAQSDVDVVIKYHFPSLSIGENPNHDPYLAQTIKETRRVSEHIRDGAPFSTKSFFCIHGGAGVEYSLSEHKTLFLQSSIQYQIPHLEFSNNNGKHIRSVSLQAGVRTPLGK